MISLAEEKLTHFVNFLCFLSFHSIPGSEVSFEDRSQTVTFKDVCAVTACQGRTFSPNIMDIHAVKFPSRVYVFSVYHT